MKSILTSVIVLILFIALAGTAHAQQTEGTIKYSRTENFTKMMASVEYMSKQRVERMAYMFGKRPDRKSYSALYFSPDQSKFEDLEEQVGPEMMRYSGKKEIFFMTRNYLKHTEYDAITMLGKVYLLNDSLHTPQWKILNDLKEVAGHICMNAQWNDTLRKQKVITWFALDWPSKAGPERFFGLPGMILEVDINNGAVILSAEQITFEPVTEKLKVPSKIKGKKVHQDDYEALLRKYFAERRQAEEPPFWGIRY